MSEFKGTKGEWFVSGTREVVSMPDQVKIGKIDGSSYEECKHNAKLIAAAPELLEALQEYVNCHAGPTSAYSKAVKAINKALDQ